ncbi:MAG: ribose-5-phosphate isomerase RpiA [Euryarchaeota archaeon]|nr:ribose-5-phosphate isomerase RpiA [Euryarchaeota archaeon]
MRTPDSNLEEKRAAGEAAADLVRDGMVIGLGTGSTVAWTIRRIGDMVDGDEDEGIDILGVPTSYQALELAISCGVPLTTLEQHPVLDLAIDGADLIDRNLVAIKGGGGAHAREKVVSCSARWFVIVADASKCAEVLSVPVPLEVLPIAANLVKRLVKEMGGVPKIRQAKMKDGPVITDNGNLVIDVDFGIIEDPKGLASELSALPGVLEHGIFDNVDQLVLGPGKVIDRR